MDGQCSMLDTVGNDMVFGATGSRNSYRVLGLDPGIGSCGIALIDFGLEEVVYLGYIFGTSLKSPKRIQALRLQGETPDLPDETSREPPTGKSIATNCSSPRVLFQVARIAPTFKPARETNPTPNYARLGLTGFSPNGNGPRFFSDFP